MVQSPPPSVAAHPEPEGLRGISTRYIQSFLQERITRYSRGGLTTEAVVEEVIKPLTQDCSLLTHVEGTHDGEQLVGKAQLFVSHAWGDNFQVAMEALLEHCAQRFGDQDHVYVWIDAFVLNQHDVDESGRTSAW
eukprot:scaffold543_cov312-Prasinococcus_capsulatus_cf.AAC.8